MKKIKQLIFKTDENIASTILRIILGVVILIHGFDKVGTGFGYFIDFMTNVLKMPAFLGWMTVFIETLGSLLLILGFATRVNATLFFGLFVGMIAFVHWQYGFQMNWAGQMEAGQEGFEYHILVLAICSALMVLGGGKFSIDNFLSKSYS